MSWCIWKSTAGALILLVLTATATTARAASATRPAVEARLRAHEIPAQAKAWQDLGSDVDARLAEIARDGKVEILVRARAVSALGFFSSAGARRCLEETIDGNINLAAANPAQRLLLRKASVALGWMGGFTVPARLGPLLENPDPEVRLDAAIGLGLTRLATAAELLRNRLPKETVDRVRTQIGRQIRAIEEAVAPSAR
jgi:HEAT repeat protein